MNKPKSPKPSGPSKPEVDAKAAQEAEKARLLAEADLTKAEKDRQEEQRRRRGAGVQSFMGPGVTGSTSALSTMLGV